MPVAPLVIGIISRGHEISEILRAVPHRSGILLD